MESDLNPSLTQQALIIQCIQKNLIRIQSQLNQLLNHDIDIMSINIYLMVNMFQTCPSQVQKRQLLYQFILLYKNVKINDEQLQHIIKIIDNKNYVGKLIYQSEVPEHNIASFRIYMQYIQLQCSTNGDFNSQFRNALFDENYSQRMIKYSIMKYINTLTPQKKLIRYQKRMVNANIYKYYHVNKQLNYDLIYNTYLQSKGILDKNNTQKLIISLYEYYINSKNYKAKYNALYIIQALAMSKNNQFFQFQLENTNIMRQITICVQKEMINTFEEFQLKSCLAKYQQNVLINLQTKEGIEQILSERTCWENLLHNITDKVLCIVSTAQFILIRNVQTNNIIYKIIQQNSQKTTDQINKNDDFGTDAYDVLGDEIIRLIQDQDNNQIYDVVICSTMKHEWVGNLRIRYLNYVLVQNDPQEHKQLNIVLKYQHDIISVSLSSVFIQNIFQCVNLKNICTKYCAYQWKYYQYLTNLEYVVSSMDTFENIGQSLVEKIMKNNLKLKYIQVQNDTNIAPKQILSEYIENIKYIQSEYICMDENYYLNESVITCYQKFLDKFVHKKDIEFYFYTSEQRKAQFNIQTMCKIQNALHFDICFKKNSIHEMLYILFSNKSIEQKIKQLTNLASKIVKAQEVSDYDLKFIEQTSQNDINKQLINKYVEYCDQHQGILYKMDTIAKICKSSCNIPQKKYIIFQIIKGLMALPENAFIQRFNCQSQQIVGQFTEIVNTSDHYINTLDELKARAQFAQYADVTELHINLNKNLQLYNIPNQTFLQLFTNVNNRLQRIFFNKCCMVIMRVCDNTINKMYIKAQQNIEDQKQIDNFLNSCTGHYEYDLIVISNQVIQQLSNIRIRHLTFINNNQNKTIMLNLNYPEIIQSLTLQKVQITNIKQCINLKTLFSCFNRYKHSDIAALKNIKMLISKEDTYSGSILTLVEDLFTQNKLDVVIIESGKNDSKPIILRDNIESLRYFCNYQHGKGQKVTLNIQHSFPKYLEVFLIEPNVGAIVGPEEKQCELKQQLIHAFINYK